MYEVTVQQGYHDALSAEHQATYWDVLSLAHELCEHEGDSLAHAMRWAADDLGFLLRYAYAWDECAYDAGNDDALDLPF